MSRQLAARYCCPWWLGEWKALEWRVEWREERERGRCESERAVPTQWVQEVVVANTEATPSSDLQPLTFRLPLAVGSAAWRRPSCGWENTGGCVQVNGERKLLRRDLILLLPVRAVFYYNKQVRGDTEFYFRYLLLANKQLCGDTKFYFLYLLLYHKQLCSDTKFYFLYLYHKYMVYVIYVIS